MNTDQLNSLINAIERLATNQSSTNYSWEILIVVLSTILANALAFGSVVYQSRKTRKQQLAFMYNEMKIKSVEKLLTATAEVNNHIINILRIGHLKRNNAKTPVTENFDLNTEVQAHFDKSQSYMSELFTFINLFGLEGEREKLDILQEKLKEVFEISFNPLNPEKLGKMLSLGQQCFDMINDFDSTVRKEHVKLLKEMKEESK